MSTPGSALLGAVLATERSACGLIVSASVAELFEGSGSLTPLGGLTVAVLDNVPVADADSDAEAVYVTDPPAGRFTASAMLPDPAAVHVPPPAPTQVHVAVSAAGNASPTVAPPASLGPALLAVIVYVTDPPAVALVMPSVLVIARS